MSHIAKRWLRLCVGGSMSCMKIYLCASCIYRWMVLTLIMADISEIAGLWLRRLLMTVVAGVLFDWTFRRVDPLLDYLRFMEPALYYERLLQTYLVLYGLFKMGAWAFKVDFKVQDMYWYVSASITVNYAFRVYVRAHLASIAQAGWATITQKITSIGYLSLSNEFMLAVLVVALLILAWLRSERRKFHTELQT